MPCRLEILCPSLTRHTEKRPDSRLVAGFPSALLASNRASTPVGAVLNHLGNTN